MTVEDTLYTVHTGDLLLIPQNSFYQPLEGGRCGYYFFHIQATPLPEDTPLPLRATAIPHTNIADGHGFGFTFPDTTPSAVSVPVYTAAASHEIRALFARAAQLNPSRRITDKLQLDALLRELLILLDRRDPHGGNKRLSGILAYVAAHYAEPLTLSTLARHFSLSESYVARLFRNELGTKPSAYVHRVRVTAATSLLLETDLSVKEIAERTGYGDVYYFSKTYKKLTGRSPLQTRNGG